MKSPISALIILLFLAFNLNAQSENTHQPCKLKLEQSPALRGLKLGMSIDTVERLLGFKFYSVKKYSKLWQWNYAGELFPPKTGYLTLSFPERIDSIKFKDVISGYLSFYDNRVYEILLNYKLRDSWTDEEFLSNLNAIFNLPDAWDERGLLICTEFTIKAVVASSEAYLKLTNVHTLTVYETKRVNSVKKTVKKKVFIP